MKNKHVNLSQEEYKYLLDLKDKTERYSKIWKRIVAIMELHRKNCLREAAEIAELSVSAVADLIKKYKEEGLNCIQHHKGNGRPLVFDESERQIIKELFYSPIPEHRKAWTLRLLAKTAVDRGLLMHISHTSVANILVSMGIYIEEAHACAS